MLKTVKYKGKTFEFHNPNNFGWVLLWTNAWEMVDEVAVALGWKRVHHGGGSFGHVSYRLA